MRTVSFCVGTSAEYAALQTKNPNALYFLEDTGMVYKGDIRVSGLAIELITRFPSKGEKNTLYVNKNTGATKYWDGIQYYKIGK